MFAGVPERPVQSVGNENIRLYSVLGRENGTNRADVGEFGAAGHESDRFARKVNQELVFIDVVSDFNGAIMAQDAGVGVCGHERKLRSFDTAAYDGDAEFTRFTGARHTHVLADGRIASE